MMLLQVLILRYGGFATGDMNGKLRLKIEIMGQAALIVQEGIRKDMRHKPRQKTRKEAE